LKAAALGLALIAAGLTACVGGPKARRTDFRPPPDAAEGLQRYYDERLNPADGGYRQRGQLYGSADLPKFYDVQGATLCAAWARGANHFDWVGLGSGLALVAVGAGISANAPSDDPAKNAWWMSLLPAGVLSWTFHWAGDGWFRKPSVALYNKRLAEKMGMQVVPSSETP
jgi:hypothetical protein